MESDNLQRSLERPIRIAAATRRYLGKLWELGVDTRAFSMSLSNMLSTAFSTIAGAVSRAITIGSRLNEMSFSGFAPLPPFSIRSRGQRQEEELPEPGGLGRVGVSLMFRVSVARRIASELARRVSTATTEAGLLQSRSLAAIGGERLGYPGPLSALATEGSTPSTEIRREVKPFPARIEAPVAVSVEGTQKAGRMAAVAAQAGAAPMMLAIPSAFAEPAAGRAVTQEEEPPETGETARLRPVGGTAGSPLAVAAASLVMPVARLATAEAARADGTGGPQTIVPTASAREGTRAIRTPGERGTPEAGGEAEEREEGREPLVPIHGMLTPSLAVARLQAAMVSGPIQPPVPLVEEDLGATEVSPVAPLAAGAATAPVQVEGGAQAIPSLIPLETMIAEKLRESFASVSQQIRGTQSRYLEPLTAISASGPPRVETLGEIATPDTGPPAPAEPAIRTQPPARTPLRPVTATEKRDLNIVVSGEVADDDLRDLERKISRILSDQVRRYYGYASFEEM